MFQTDGQYLDTRIGGAGFTPVVGQWWSESPQASIGNDYEIKLEYLVGTNIYQSSGGTAGVWYPLSSTQQWEWTFWGSGYASQTLGISIRDVATQTIQDTSEIVVFLERTL